MHEPAAPSPCVRVPARVRVRARTCIACVRARVRPRARLRLLQRVSARSTWGSVTLAPSPGPQDTRVPSRPLLTPQHCVFLPINRG